MNPLKPSARSVATEVLHRVAEKGAFAAPTLDAELARAKLADRDARLAAEIVYGTLRVLPRLDAAIDKHLSRGRPDPYTFAALRGAAYQALHLSRVPPHAIVQETVELVKGKRGKGTSRFANAVLRRVVQGRPKEPAPPTSLEVDDWVRQTLVEGLGAERAESVLTAPTTAPPIGLRVHGMDREEVKRVIEAQLGRGRVELSPLAPHGLRAWGVGDPRKLPGFDEGHLSVQDEGAQWVSHFVGAKPRERVLDACSGRGGKTSQLLQAVGPEGHVTAVDVHERKLEKLQVEMERLKLPVQALSCEAIDLSVGDGGLPHGSFDRVLVDAPCSGLGTLRRRPELALRLTPADLGRLAQLQLKILRQAVLLVRPGGTLIYVVCSASQIEAAGVLAELESSTTALTRGPAALEDDEITVESDGVIRVGPWLRSGDGSPDVYQIIRWQRLDSGSGAI